MILSFFQKGKYIVALEIIDALLKEVRKADDKHLLVEIQLHESKLYHALQNFAKAKVGERIFKEKLLKKLFDEKVIYFFFFLF